MRGKAYSEKTKERVRQLMKRGNSYGTIRHITGVPESTTSTWYKEGFKNPHSKEEMLRHLKKIRKKAVEAIKKKHEGLREKQNEIARCAVKQELKKFSFENSASCKSLLAMLYWAEGAKHKGVAGLKLVNTDPGLLSFFVALLRKSYDINEKKFSIGLHLHTYHKRKEAKRFWSKLLKIPEDQFRKIYIKKRSKHKHFRRNFMGICLVYYGDSAIRRELLELATSLQEVMIDSSRKRSS